MAHASRPTSERWGRSYDALKGEQAYQKTYKSSQSTPAWRNITLNVWGKNYENCNRCSTKRLRNGLRSERVCTSTTDVNTFVLGTMEHSSTQPSVSSTIHYRGFSCGGHGPGKDKTNCVRQNSATTLHTLHPDPPVLHHAVTDGLGCNVPMVQTKSSHHAQAVTEGHIRVHHGPSQPSGTH